MRKPAGLDLGDLADFPTKPKKNEVSQTERTKAKKIATSAALKEGFSSRQGLEKVDGRTLRKTNKKSQLNIAVRESTKNLFWSLAQKLEFTGGDEFLSYLLNMVETNSSEER